MEQDIHFPFKIMAKRWKMVQHFQIKQRFPAQGLLLAVRPLYTAVYAHFHPNPVQFGPKRGEKRPKWVILGRFSSIFT